METHRVHVTTDPAFAALVSIYTDALPANERKSIERLTSMLQQPEYLFLVAVHENVIIGFSITLCFAAGDACLLEYMAVDAARRGQGTGQYLFTEVTKRKEVSDRFLLMEVDSDKARTPVAAEAARRKSFYRKLGCKEVEGLHYIMPPVTRTHPPEMNLLACKQNLPSSIDKAHLQAWLQCVYVGVYGQAADDPRIQRMIEGLPDNILLA